MMVDMSSVVFWPWKSYAKSELLIQVKPIGDIRSGPLTALVLAGEARRPYWRSCNEVCGETLSTIVTPDMPRRLGGNGHLV